MITPEEKVQVLCPVVFGAHDWVWHETPSLIHFGLVTSALIGETYERTCRRCNAHQALYAPAPPPGERILEHC